MAALSPMMQQYFEIKKQHPGEILFFRLGDFYEMFYDDAILASKELELTLTGRDCGQAERAPMCGVPFHSYENYVAKLIAKGYKVAICEQMEDPALSKGLVKRDIIRVVTPGTVIESSMLEDDKNNYIGSVMILGKQAGVCFADISTGTAYAAVLTGGDIDGQLIGELCRYTPRELLLNPDVLPHKSVTQYIKQQLRCTVELLEKGEYAPAICMDEMCTQFGEQPEQAAHLPPDSPAFTALAVLIGYLKRTQKRGLERLKTVIPYTEAQYMHLSPVTRANLELTQTMRGREKKGTLLWVLDKTKTAMGKRLMRAWIEQPLLDPVQINARLDSVEELWKESVARADLIEELSGVFDLERLLTRIVYGSASPRDVYTFASACGHLPALKTLLRSFSSAALAGVQADIDGLEDLRELIVKAVDENAPALLKDGGVICAGYNAEVDELRDIVHGGKGYLASLETKLKEETGIRTLKIGYNRVFGYYIEVSRSFVKQVPDNFIRKQTLTTGERYITEELKTLESRILGASDRLIVLERQLFDELLQRIAGEAARIQQTASGVARLDVLTALAQAASQNGYVKPVVERGDALLIQDGRHPVIEQMLKDSMFVPNDTTMDCAENRLLLLTGPNMAGKSTYMRQTALIALMAQIGSFVPAKMCRMGVVDAIFTRVGAQDDLSAGQSTFMVEMTEVAEILRYATPKSLVILDEIGRGTSTFDGMSIARAVVEHMVDRQKGIGCKTLFATHYHELTELEHMVNGIRNYNIAVRKRGDDITFLRRIVRGPADDSYGIEVAKLAGLPDSVTVRAKEVLRELEESAPATGATQLNFEVLGRADAQGALKACLDEVKASDVDALTPQEAKALLHKLRQSLPQ